MRIADLQAITLFARLLAPTTPRTEQEIMKRWPTEEEVDGMDTFQLSCLANGLGCFASFRDLSSRKSQLKLLKTQLAEKK